MNRSVADQANAIRNNLDALAHQDGGKALVASDLAHMWAMAWVKSDSPRIIVCYTGEQVRGPFAIAAYTHRVDRSFIVMVTRGRGFNAERGDSLTATVGNARPLFTLAEESRDAIRAMLDISQEWPVDYKSMRNYQAGEIALDAYIIEFSVATDLPELSNSPANPAPLIGT